MAFERHFPLGDISRFPSFDAMPLAGEHRGVLICYKRIANIANLYSFVELVPFGLQAIIVLIIPIPLSKTPYCLQ